MSQKRKIAVLGGGMGAISAAFALTRLPDWSSRFEITIYQRGWRLGGKAASGRNMAAYGRVEEQGLHIWSGAFNQSIAMMRECYSAMPELGLRKPEAVLGTFDKAFKPLNHLFIPETFQTPNGIARQEPWRINATAEATSETPTEPDNQTPQFLGIISLSNIFLLPHLIL